MDAARWCFVLICQTPLTEGKRGSGEGGCGVGGWTGLREEEGGKKGAFIDHNTSV